MESTEALTVFVCIILSKVWACTPPAAKAAVAAAASTKRLLLPAIVCVVTFLWRCDVDFFLNVVRSVEGP